MNELRKVLPSWIAPALVVAGMLYAFVLVSPVLEPGYNRAGDDPIHVAYEHELANIVKAEGHPLGWSYLYGVGAPIFIFRPPLFYYAALAVEALGFGVLTLPVAHKLVFVLALCLFPLSLYLGLRKLDCDRIEAGAASMMALFPISTFGHTLDAYFSLGLAKQLIAISLFPFVLGAAHAALVRRGSVVRAGFWAGLAFLSHPYVGFCLFLVLGLDILLLISGRGPRAAVPAVARLCGIGLLLVGISAFYTIPMYTSPEIQRIGGYTGSWRSGFEVICETTTRTVLHFVNGSLLDSTAAGRFGGGEWGWHDNSRYFRWPALSWLAVAGWIVALFRLRRPGYALLAAGLPASLLFFSGPDDVPQLAWIPFQDQFQYLHAVFLVEFLAIALAGVALGTMMGWLSSTVERLAGRTEGVRGRNAGSLAAALAAVAILAVPAWERFRYSADVVDTLPFDTRNGRVSTSRQATAAIDRDFDACLAALGEQGALSRLYGAPAGAADPVEVFYLNLAPGLLDQTNVISGFFGVEAGGANYLLNEHFRKPMAGSPNLLRLFNVSHLLAHRSNEAQFLPLGTTVAPRVRNDSWLLLRSRMRPSEFDYARVRPILVFASPSHWEGACREWLTTLSDMPFVDALPWLVLAPDPRPSHVAIDSTRYSAVFLVDPRFDGEHDRAEARRRLDEFRRGGGQVVSLMEHAGIEARIVGETPWILDEAVLRGVGHEVEFTAPSAERGRHGTSYRADHEHLFMFKQAYYRGWRVEIDGQPAPLINVSPGFCGFFGPAGTHTVEVHYHGANGQWAGVALTALTLLVVGGYELNDRIRRRRRTPVLHRVPEASVAA